LGNHAPVINAIILNPDRNFTPGSEINIHAVIEDPDGDELDITWESDGGEIIEHHSSSISWVLFPTAEPFSYEEITLTVSDGKESVRHTETIQVSEGLMMTGYTFYKGTTIPVPGVELTMGRFSTVSDMDGSYTIENLKEGYTLVTAQKEGFDTFENTVYVDNPRSLFQIPMTSSTMTSQVSGVIKTSDNIAREGLKVSVLNPDSSDSELLGYTDDLGYYHIENVPHGTRKLLIRNEFPESHFLDDSMIFEVVLDEQVKAHDARIKIKRTIVDDLLLSQKELWEFDGDDSDGFYLLGKGQTMNLKDYISIPSDAEDAILYLSTFVVGGCDMVGKLPSHRVWISNMDGKYLGGISWGGEGANYQAEVAWHPSSSPTFLYIYGKQIKLHLELFEESDCIPNPFWRIYQIQFSYYH
jgi:hypothetical protein